MTGGDVLKGRPLNGSWLEFSIIGKIFLATNSLPQINNTDHGIWRRIQAIPFNRTFSAEEQDKELDIYDLEKPVLELGSGKKRMRLQINQQDKFVKRIFNSCGWDQWYGSTVVRGRDG